VFVDDEDLPSRGRVDGADGVEKLYTGRMSGIRLLVKLERTISDSGDEGGHAVGVKVRTAGAALGTSTGQTHAAISDSLLKLNKIANSHHSTNQPHNRIPSTPCCIRVTLRIRLRACDSACV
jgi:hypothetical protein